MLAEPDELALDQLLLGLRVPAVELERLPGSVPCR
jgi:hypothetical protein